MKPASASDDTDTVYVEVSGPRLNLDRNITEKLYHWLLVWFAKNCQGLTNFAARERNEQNEYGKNTIKIERVPGFGEKMSFDYKGTSIQVERVATPEIVCNGISYEKIVLSTCKKDLHLIDELLEECKPGRKEDEKRKTIIYGANFGTWHKIGHPKKRRQLSSVILPEEVKARLIKDMQDFRDSEQWYVDRGIPYRRGYLLYGPPGCGKSSLIRSIAGEIGYDICMLPLTAREIDDETMNHLMNTTPENCIILLEDIDAAFKSREDAGTGKEHNLAFEGMGGSSVTFAGLLNALDGVAATEGRLLFMTTNYVDRLDPAMFRPGRVDMKLLVDYPNDEQLSGIFAGFYPDAGEAKGSEFVKKIRKLKTYVSMAAVQGLFMMHKESAQEAIDNLDKYFKEQLLLGGKDQDKDLYV